MDAFPTDPRAPLPKGSADMPATPLVLEVRPSANGRTHGKAWKGEKGATRRSTMPASLRSSYAKRMEKETERKAIKAVEQELKDEAEAARESKATRIRERRARKEEKERLENMAAKMSAKKLQRMRKRQGRSKKING